jgi:membrane protease YdiL (CAAX protease family)
MIPDISNERIGQPEFWTTVRLILGAARKRSAGRRRRQQELLNARSGKAATDWSGLGSAMMILFMLILNALAAFVVWMAVEAGERADAESQGKIVVSQPFLDAVNLVENPSSIPIKQRIALLPYEAEAKRIAEREGGSQAAIEQKLRDSVAQHGLRDLVTEKQAAPGFTAFLADGPLPAMLGSLVLLWWAMMLVFQGEGLEMDLQRRRHPMWEWLFAHPVPPGAIFLAEMLSPIVANPAYWGAPLFVGLVYGFVYGPGLGILAGFLLGVPITVAAACLGKATEIAVILRVAPRSRGAIIGIMSWLGYASTMLFVVAISALPKIAIHANAFMNALLVVPWPWLRLFVGGQADGSFSFLAGMLTCLLASGIAIAAAVQFSVWGAQQGLSGNFAAVDLGPSRSSMGTTRFGRDPLYGKEFLWFIRDRSAIVQTILIPLSVAAVQVFNLRILLVHAQGAWNYLCGAAILFGTYFLWILGPKSLASEGTALWIALTWPRGLESLLKAKAWLWSLISSGIVLLVLAYAGFLFPTHIWKIALVGLGWFLFGRSMAEKAVTLVTITSESGETQKIPWGRRMATQLGMLTFAIGVLTQQWQVAIVGIVYSYLTAAAMWQNFRARLPYLYDPWSEKLPPPPTLMHAMVSISILVEVGAIATGMLAAAMGRENIAIAQAMSYALCAVAVSIGVSEFLGNRGVSPPEVWNWETTPRSPGETTKPWWRSFGFWDPKSFPGFFAGASAGIALGIVAHGYLALLSQLPATAEILRKSQQQMASVPYLKSSYFVMAVLFAPFAEEYLFRGLLFRALDREWGGWRAILGSAAFFAIYHPALAWPPVALVGVANAILFRKTGRLAPAVVLHMAYNAVVLS